MKGNSSLGRRVVNVFLWVVPFPAVLGTTVLSTAFWPMRCQSVIFVELMDTYNITREEASWPLTASFVSMCVLSPIAGSLSSKIDAKLLYAVTSLIAFAAVFLSSYAKTVMHLIITLGLLNGVSSSLAVTLGPAIVGQYFSKYRTQANGLFFASPALISMCGPSILKFVIGRYGLPWTFFIGSGINLLGIPAGIALWRMELPEKAAVPKTSTNGTSPEDKKLEEHLKLTEIFQMKWFYVLVIMNFSFGLGNSSMSNIIEDLGRDNHMSPILATNLVGMMSIGDLAARLGSPCITDKGFIKREYLYILNLLISGSTYFTLSTVSNPILYCAGVILIGWCHGSTLVLFTDLNRKYLGLKNIAVGSGWCFLFLGLLTMLRPMTIGYSRDTYGTYKPILFILGTSMFIGATTCLLAVLSESKKESEEKGPEPVEDLPAIIDTEGREMRLRAGSVCPSIS